MSPTSDILIVEDDENLGLALRDNLEEEGYTVELARDGRLALEAVGKRDFVLVILDLMLPDVDGYTLCRRLREHDATILILMLTARTLEEDLERGFEAGADDYLTKPYRIRELLLRVRALLRRRGTSGADEALAFARYEIDLAARRVTDDAGVAVELTRTEFDLLVHFLRHRNRALTRAELLDEVWGKEIVVDERTVDNFVSSLKKKLNWKVHGGFRIRTIRGVGYRMEVDEG